MKGNPDARLLAATVAVVSGASSSAAIGAALGAYSPGPLLPEEPAKQYPGMAAAGRPGDVTEFFMGGRRPPRTHSIGYRPRSTMPIRGRPGGRR